MLATIVTYELVLLQFDSEPDEQVDAVLNIDACALPPKDSYWIYVENKNQNKNFSWKC